MAGRLDGRSPGRLPSVRIFLDTNRPVVAGLIGMANQRTVYPTEVDTYLNCGRKWWYRYPGQVKRPKNEYAIKGLALHDEINAYLLSQYPYVVHDWKTGEPLNELPEGLYVETSKEPPALPDTLSDAAIAMLGKYPLELRLVAVERKYKVEYGSTGLVFGGVMDALFVDDERYAAVPVDAKSTTNPAVIPTADDLLADPQQVIYAWIAKEVMARPVYSRWIYPKKTVETPWQSMADISESMAAVARIALEMRGIEALQPEAEDIDRNLAACEDYGKCPYQDICLVGVSDRDRMRAALRRASNTGRTKHSQTTKEE